MLSEEERDCLHEEAVGRAFAMVTEFLSHREETPQGGWYFPFTNLLTDLACEGNSAITAMELGGMIAHLVSDLAFIVDEDVMSIWQEWALANAKDPLHFKEIG